MDRPPSRIRRILTDISRNPTANDAMEAMMQRAKDFSSPLAAKLAGIALNDRARDMFDDELDDIWANTKIPARTSDIIVGGGLHAAIFSAIRVREGFAKPLVIEANNRVGGAFAASRKATFYLNSRNRPGALGVPGRNEALNYLPGAPIQPADLSYEEFQTNLSLSFPIRTSLAMYANVVSGHRVVDATRDGVQLDNGKNIDASRVIYATGLNKPRMPKHVDGKHCIGYMDFLAMLDKPFPFQGIRRVAVVGAGDSGKTVIEALVGQGPQSNWSVTSLDWIEQIDWYGVPAEANGKSRWEQCNRGRYKRIANVLPRDGKGGRVNPFSGFVSDDEVSIGYDGAYVQGVRYDLVVWATGFETFDMSGLELCMLNGRAVARRDEQGVYLIGPAAQIEDEVTDRLSIQENKVALFNYADRTAALAATKKTPMTKSEENGELFASVQPTGDY